MSSEGNDNRKMSTILNLSVSHFLFESSFYCNIANNKAYYMQFFLFEVMMTL